MVRLSGVVKAVAGAIVALGLLGCGLHVSNSSGGDVAQAAPGTLRIATHNVHYIVLGQDTGAWSVGDWEARAPSVDAAFKAMDADIVAFQEMESFQRGSDGSVNLARDYLLAQNPGYRAGASGDWRVFPSTQPIFYRADRLTQVEQGWFFFSDTPDVIYSRTFNGSYPAFASWSLLQDRSGAKLRVINVHFEFKSASNRQKSAKLVAERATPWLAAGERVVLVGDLNARAGAATLEILERAGFTFLPVTGATYHLNRGLHLFGAIDHIALAGVRATSYPVVLQRRFAGRWPSDHHPVLVDLTLN